MVVEEASLHNKRLGPDDFGEVEDKCE